MCTSIHALTSHCLYSRSEIKANMFDIQKQYKNTKIYTKFENEKMVCAKRLQRSKNPQKISTELTTLPEERF